MASSKEYLQFLLDQLSDLKEITYRMTVSYTHLTLPTKLEV